ncbi:histidine kinase [Silvibacterium acidisoli]|uniref:histidine kinase n=1 Tax=Acidobacteriaceae bacterium ZG23-2 TaxID=2883246 RepID=UPI00406CADBA
MKSRTLVLSAAILVAVVAAAFLLLPRLHRHAYHGVLYQDSFARNSTEEWQAFGGNWEVMNGAMQNDSNERGAKLMTGSNDWTDYVFEGDVQLPGQEGDAGLIVRSRNEEEGVDSYRGYYAGLRTLDGLLVVGRSDHGWVEYPGKPMPGGVHPFSWYHLRVAAIGCSIQATATELATGATETQTIHDGPCYKSGRVGLRSHSSGGIWRNLRVTAIAPGAAMPSMAATPMVPHGAQTEVGNIAFERGQLAESGRNPEDLALPHPIGSLRTWVQTGRTQPTVRGVVVLTTPRLFVQDTTGGVAVLPRNTPDLKVGDEVEASGDVEPHNFSAVLKNATVRLLWPRAPLPALAVTPDQAATGAYDATYIELEGRLESKHTATDGGLVLELAGGSQSFRAIMHTGRESRLFESLALHSLLRLRGICVVDSAFTANQTPFVLLIPSREDVQVLAGPPWWSARQLGIFGLIALLLFLCGYLIYLRARHWRLQAISEERERLAHEMHDTLAQSFAGIGFQLQAIRNRLPSEAGSVVKQLELAHRLVRHSHEEARQSLATLRSDFLAARGIHGALEDCARRMVDGGQTTIAMQVSGDLTKVPLRLQETFFRIGQEAIANAIQHGSPRKVSIQLDCSRHELSMCILDDGKGFDTGRENHGFGLGGMNKRAIAVSATLNIHSEPGAGTRVEVRAHLRPFQAWFAAAWFAKNRRDGGKRESQIDPYSYRR